MDKILLPTQSNFSLPTSFHTFLASILLLIFALFSFSRSKQQRIIPDVPVIGVDGTDDLVEARHKFRHGSKSMLLEGYQKV